MLQDMILRRLDQVERQADAIKADVLLLRRLLALAENGEELDSDASARTTSDNLVNKVEP